LFSNGSFESGDFGNFSSTFAGQTANKAREERGPDNQVRWSLDNWTFSVSDSGNFNRWVSDGDNPVMAQSGSKYAYLSSDTTDLVSNSTLRYGPGVNFTAGNTYRFSFYAADANSQASGTKIGFEINPLSTSGTTSHFDDRPRYCYSRI
jgi:hypothetical protein